MRATSSCGVAEADAGGLDPVGTGGVGDQRAPAAAHVEEALAGPQPELPADELELCALRALQPVHARGPVGARVDELIVEEEAVEVVPHVVVTPDAVLVAGERVAGGGAQKLAGPGADACHQPGRQRGGGERVRA